MKTKLLKAGAMKLAEVGIAQAEAGKVHKTLTVAMRFQKWFIVCDICGAQWVIGESGDLYEIEQISVGNGACS